jgi:hypothetical protein
VDRRSVVFMAIVTLNSALVAIRGRVGDVVFKTYRDKIVMTRVPRFAPGVVSPAQRTRRDRLKAATAFAQRVYASASSRAFYTAEARRLGRQPFRLAISDHLRCADHPSENPTSAESARFAAAGRLLSPPAPPPLPAGSRPRSAPFAAARKRISRPGWSGPARGAAARAKGGFSRGERGVRPPGLRFAGRRSHAREELARGGGGTRPVSRMRRAGAERPAGIRARNARPVANGEDRKRTIVTISHA